MAIGKGYKKNFETMQKAMKNGDLAIIEVQEKATGKTRVAICAVGREGSEYVICPFALMFDGNPYEELNPPNPEGGFYTD